MEASSMRSKMRNETEEEEHVHTHAHKQRRMHVDRTESRPTEGDTRGMSSVM